LGLFCNFDGTVFSARYVFSAAAGDAAASSRSELTLLLVPLA
jgi:hypothetical protein